MIVQTVCRWGPSRICVVRRRREREAMKPS
jgi:hypothetical protein